MSHVLITLNRSVIGQSYWVANSLCHVGPISTHVFTKLNKAEIQIQKSDRDKMAGPIPRTAVAKKIIKHRINYNGSKQYKVLWEYYPDKPEGYVSFEAKKNMLDWGKANSLIRKYDFEVANKSAIEARKGDIKMFKRRHFKDSANPNHSCHRMKTRNDARNEIESSDSHTSSSSNIPTGKYGLNLRH